MDTKETVLVIMEQFNWSIAATFIGGEKAMYYSTEEGNPVFSFAFKAKAKNKANRCEIIYERRTDLYTMKFFRVWGKKRTDIETVECVFCDQLQDVFETKTGLFLHF